MLKRLFQSSQNGSAPPPEEIRGGNDSAPPLAEPVTAAVHRDIPSTPAAPEIAIRPSDPFDYVYQSAAIQPPARSFGIRKVADMVVSPYLSGMSPELKRNSVQIALEAAGAEIDPLLEDSVLRQRALNEYKETLQEKLREVEASKNEDARGIQAELDHLTAQCMVRIQANLVDIAREQDAFRSWPRRKLSESQRIADAAMYCVPNGARTGTEGFQTCWSRAPRQGWR